MADTILVSLAVMAGIVALAGVPLRCWQLYTGRLRERVPRHAIARATFGLFSALFFVPNALAWAHALYVTYRDLTCTGPCPAQGVAAAVAIGMLGCAYALLEGFLLAARRRSEPPEGGPAPRDRSPPGE